MQLWRWRIGIDYDDAFGLANLYTPPPPPSPLSSLSFALPGPTGPNRMMLHAATTRGYDGGQYDAGPYLMHARTVYEDLQDEGERGEGSKRVFVWAASVTCLFFMSFFIQGTRGAYTGKSICPHAITHVALSPRNNPHRSQAHSTNLRRTRQDFSTAHAITPLSSYPNTSAFIKRDVAFEQFFQGQTLLE